MRRALITGITGQDGTYLAELLLAKGYEVFGMARGQSNPRVEELRQLLPDVRLVPGDLIDTVSLARAVDAAAPDEVYNLAAITFVQYTFAHPLLTAEVNGLGALRLLEAVRSAGARMTRFYQASTSELFGQAREAPQNERTPFHPRSPYAFSKAFAHHATVNYRESYGMFAVGGILFNHESPRRGREFVTRKITYHAAAIKLGLAETVELGNLEARRDWGFAGDYVPAMWLMLQQPEPVDYVVGTGVLHSVREFADEAFRAVGLRWEDHVVTSEAHLRPADVPALVADASRAHAELGWRPTVSFSELVAMMVESDLRLLGDGSRSRPRVRAAPARAVPEQVVGAG